MSRSRLPFRMIPDSFIDACASGEITKRQFFLGCFLLRFASYKTRELSMTVANLGLRSGYGLSPRSLRRDLKALSPAWVEFEARPGQRTPYKFRITGLWARADDFSPGHDLDNELPDSVQVELPPAEVPAATPVQVPGQPGAARGEGLCGVGDPLPVQVPAEPPVQVPLSTTSTTSTEGSKGKASSEENYDQDVGKTTAAATNFVQVVGEVAAAALERERVFLDELDEVFVVKGGGRWIEPGDDGSERR